MTAPLGAIQTTGGLQPPPGQRNLSMAAATGAFTLTGVTANLTATISNIHAITLNDGHSDPLYIGNVFTGSSVFIAQDFSVANEPLSRIEYRPTNLASTWQTLDVVGTDARVQLRSQKHDNSGVNPQVVVSDLASFGIPVFPGGNQAGIGLLWNGVPSATAGALNIANLGGGNTGEFNSCLINIWGASPSGDTQNIITFFNGTGPNAWDNAMVATPAGGRLGEICGCGSLPDGHFTQTETASINFYAEAQFSGTMNDGSYTAPCNIVSRVAPNALAPERIIRVDDYNANLLVGANGSADGFTAFGNAVSGFTKNSVVMRNAGGDPSNQYATGGILYVNSGALKYKGSSGTVTTLASA